MSIAKMLGYAQRSEEEEHAKSPSAALAKTAEYEGEAFKVSQTGRAVVPSEARLREDATVLSSNISAIEDHRASLVQSKIYTDSEIRRLQRLSFEQGAAIIGYDQALKAMNHFKDKIDNPKRAKAPAPKPGESATSDELDNMEAAVEQALADGFDPK